MRCPTHIYVHTIARVETIFCINIIITSEWQLVLVAASDVYSAGRRDVRQRLHVFLDIC